MPDNAITLERLNSLAHLAGFAWGSGADTPEQAAHVLATVSDDARANHYPVAPLFVTFVVAYERGRAAIDG